ncbi:hypothetical protein DXG01_005830 [Tephrocybe rancida]|nr:hypothetical protein DXG01_005830 [Tephrocybe rancida]
MYDFGLDSALPTDLNFTSSLALISEAPPPVRPLLRFLLLFEEVHKWSMPFSSSYSVDTSGFNLKFNNWIQYLKDKVGSGYGRDLSKNTWEIIWKIHLYVSRWTAPIKKTNRQAMEELDGMLRDIIAAHTTLTVSLAPPCSELWRDRPAQTDPKNYLREQRSQLDWLERELGRFTTSSIAYDKQSRVPCDDGTRLHHLKDIKDWIHDGSLQNVLWLIGEPICGKSTVAVSVAKYCQEKRMLGAMLFIDHNTPETTNPDKYFATLVGQILRSLVDQWGISDVSEVIQHRLHDLLRGDPTLFDHMTIHQATTLFVETVKDFSRLATTFLNSATWLRMVIIIDGFDNIDNDRLDETAGIFSSIFEALAGVLNVKIMVCSGNNHALFRSSGNIRNLYLDASEPYPDILKYITTQLLRISKAFNLDPKQLSGKYLGMMANQASHNIFKAFAVKEIVNRYLSKSAIKIEDLPGFLELLGADIASAQSTFYELDRPQGIQIASSMLDEIFKQPHRYRRLLETNDQETQVILDGCQELLDSSNELSSTKRGEITAAMYRLSAKTELYPQHLVLDWHTFSNILDKSEAASSGAFGDIYKVWYRGEHLSFKTTRPNKAFAVSMAKIVRKAQAQLPQANILVDRSGRAYVADFGLANVHNSHIAHWTSQSSVASRGGTSRYQAPELHRVESDGEDVSSARSTIHNSKQTDVYAWGGLCYEILTDKVPFHEIPNELAVVFHIMNRQTPTRPSNQSDAWIVYGMTQELWGILEQCWNYEPARRPAMSDIVAYLASIKPQDDRPDPQWTQGTARLFRNSQKRFDLQRAGSSHRLDALIELLTKLTPTMDGYCVESDETIVQDV